MVTGIIIRYLSGLLTMEINWLYFPPGNICFIEEVVMKNYKRTLTGIPGIILVSIAPAGCSDVYAPRGKAGYVVLTG
jgi:hypothetical protein